jgi:hypothetical protein
MSRLKTVGLRLIEFSLYGHGVLHFVELGLALYEEAYITAGVAGFGALTMMFGAVFLGTTHRHTPLPVIEKNGSASQINREL